MLTRIHQTNKAFLRCTMALFLFVCINAFAQQKLPDVLITVDVKSAKMSDLLEQISKQSGIAFSYNPKKIQPDALVDYTVTSQPLALVLDEVSQKLGLQYSFVENQIILKPKEGSTFSVTQTLSGYVRKQRSGEVLIGASLYIKELQVGAASNAFGFFSMTVPKGNYTLICSFIGHKSMTFDVDLNGAVKQDVSLEEEPPVLKEVVVTGTSPDVVGGIQTSKVNVRPAAVEERPALFGETDVVKSLESIPGIKLHSDGSTFYYVRGGNRDQNMILMDDAPIYNPSHLLGFFSTIIPEAVNDINIYKGNMPASLGGRLSSVLDVRTKKGNDQHQQGWGSVGLISTKLGVEGPFEKGVSSYVVTTRFSRLKWFFQQADKNLQKFNFYDLNAKVNFKLGSRNRVYFSFYNGADNYFSNNNGIAWTNLASALRWNHLFNDKLFLNTTFAASNYDYFLYTDVAHDTKWHSHISNANLKSDFSYFIRPENELTFGAGINGYFFNPGNITSISPLPALPTLSVKNSVELVLYANHEIKLGKRWGLNYGARLSSWTNTGEAFEFVFDTNGNPIDTLHYAKGQAYKTFVRVEPRLTASFQLNDESSLKFSFSRNVQNIHLITNSISPFTSMEVWLPSSTNIQPQAANQLTAGYYHALDQLGVTLSMEGYYKKMTHQIDYSSHAETLLNPLVERELYFGTATSYGVEFLAKKDAGRLRGWAGYTYSRATRTFADLNQGRAYNAFYDRPNQVNLMVAYDITLRWNLGLNWNYSTGAPFSSPVSFYRFNGLEVPVYGQKNNDRLPDYHRLDLTGTFRLNKNPEKKFHHSLTFSIYNVYGRKNPLFINYNKIEMGDGTFKIPTNSVDATRQTTQFYLFNFTPSISYNFKWL